MLDVARDLVNSNADAGYASLSIVLSYFELIYLYHCGHTEDIQGGRLPHSPSYYFYKGFQLVIEELGWHRTNLDEIKKRLYKGLRCGLYHAGMARPQVWVSDTIPSPYVIEYGEVTVNPRLLIEGLHHHFEIYISTLRRSCNQETYGSLHNGFESRFNAEVTDKVKARLHNAAMMMLGEAS